MKDETERLIAEAEEHINKREFTDAAKCYEKAAEGTDDKKEAVQFLKKAAQAYDKMRYTEDAVRCYLQAAEFLEKTEKAECLVACFKVYVLAIAGCAYDCGFEWRGATDGSHDDDHDFYQEQIKKYRKGAEKLLSEAIAVEGADKEKIIQQARNECKTREKESGWGASACWNILANATGGR